MYYIYIENFYIHLQLKLIYVFKYFFILLYSSYNRLKNFWFSIESLKNIPILNDILYGFMIIWNYTFFLIFPKNLTYYIETFWYCKDKINKILFLLSFSWLFRHLLSYTSENLKYQSGDMIVYYKENFNLFLPIIKFFRYNVFLNASRITNDLTLNKNFYFHIRLILFLLNIFSYKNIFSILNIYTSIRIYLLHILVFSHKLLLKKQLVMFSIIFFSHAKFFLKLIYKILYSPLMFFFSILVCFSNTLIFNTLFFFSECVTRILDWIILHKYYCLVIILIATSCFISPIFFLGLILSSISSVTNYYTLNWWYTIMVIMVSKYFTYIPQLLDWLPLDWIYSAWNIKFNLVGSYSRYRLFHNYEYYLSIIMIIIYTTIIIT